MNSRNHSSCPSRNSTKQSAIIQILPPKLLEDSSIPIAFANHHTVHVVDMLALLVMFDDIYRMMPVTALQVMPILKAAQCLRTNTNFASHKKYWIQFLPVISNYLSITIPTPSSLYKALVLMATLLSHH